MIKTPVCDILGIENPILQGGMAWIADGRLAAAVSNGGGLGIISAMNAGADYLREQIRTARSLTDKPFGVNIMLMSPFVEEVSRVAAEEKVAVVTTGAGNPARFIPMWKDAGIKVIPVVASVALCKLLTRAGADAIIAEGGESGGHVGETSTLVLVPQVCDATRLPVIAAGGIADGRGVAACFLLGAVGVQLGTRFLVADECSVHENYKDKIIAANDIATITTGKRLGHPVRSLKTPFSRAYYKAEYSGMSDDELEALGGGALRLAAVEGDLEKGCFLAGQAAGMVRRRQPAAEIIREIFEEAENVLSGASRWIR
ncbi:MAG: enoyl-[acyl-carrier-protein] reductase FabK [Clostridiales bacterium]|nr:enoyl-[acyl-carrier-protein] reductase FabK [Clostridiales bacterium]